MEEDFNKENGMLFSKFEEVTGLFLQLKSLSKSQKSQIDGLSYDNAALEEEVRRLRKTNSQLREKLGILEKNVKEESSLVPQNFKIRNKLVKIVSDIEERESGEEVELRELIDSLIEEIDICISQLSE